MPTTYEAIATVTVGSGGAANIEFTSIPATFTDLAIKYSLRGDAGAISRSVYVTFNNNTSSYSDRYLQGDGSSASSGTNSGGTTKFYAGECTASTATSSTFGNQELYIPNYAGSSNKSISIDAVAETNATTQYMSLVASLWSNSAAITSIKLVPGTGNFVQHSTATLYGIKNS